MKVISLWQPWASAIALGHKRIETRSWSTRYRGPLAIHAALRWQAEQRDFATIEAARGLLPDQFPFGSIVATCELVDVRTTDELLPAIGAVEQLFGDYAAGRFGWILENIRPLEQPIALTGRQGLFNVPEDYLELLGVELAQGRLL